MRTLLMIGIVCVLAGVGGCGGNTPDAVAQKSIATMDAMSEALEKGDKDKAKAAAQAFKDVDAKMKALNLTAEQKKALEEKYKPQMEAAVKRLFGAMAAAMAGGKFTEADLNEIGAAMKAK